MKKYFILVILLLYASSFSFADSGQEACDFVKKYKPYKNSADTLTDICSIYVHAVFYNSKFKDLVYSKNDNSTYIVTIISSVGKPRPDVLEAAPALAQSERMKVKGELRLEWIVDMDKGQVKPYNYLAQDCLRLYEDMNSALGVILKKN